MLHRPLLSSALILMLLIGSAACVPAQLPPQMAFTPGPAAIVQDTLVVMASGSRIPRPASWDVQLSAANAPEAVTLIAPDKQAIIIVSPDANYPLPDVASLPNESRVIIKETVMVSGSGTPLSLWLITLEEQRGEGVETLEKVIRAVAAGNA